jgi:hypothetical protein
MNSAKDPQTGPQRRPRPFAGVAVHLPFPVAIVVSCPFACAFVIAPVAHGRMCDLQFARDTPIAAPVIGLENRRATRHPTLDDLQAVTAIGVVPDEVAHRPAVTLSNGKDRGAIILIGPVPALLVGTAARRVVGVRMRGAFFPPRSDTPHRPQRPGPVAPPSAAGCRGFAAPAGESVCACLRESSSSRASRAVDSPLATPRQSNTRWAGDWRVLAKIVPLSSV